MLDVAMAASGVRWSCAGRGKGELLARAGALTPYLAETIVEDARRAGPDARMALTIFPDAPPDLVAPLLATLARLAARGIRVRIHRREPAAA